MRRARPPGADIDSTELFPVELEMGDALVFKGDCMHAGFDYDVDNTRVHVYVSVAGGGPDSSVPKDASGYTTLDMKERVNPTTSTIAREARKRQRNT